VLRHVSKCARTAALNDEGFRPGVSLRWRNSLKLEPSHDQFTKPNATPDQYFADMRDCFREWRRVLKRGARCLVLIGDAIVSKRAVTVADTYVEIAAASGLRLEDRWVRKLQATKRAFNVKNSRMSHEHMLLFRKP
jgi:hypothetical protein